MHKMRSERTKGTKGTRPQVATNTIRNTQHRTRSTQHGEDERRDEATAMAVHDSTLPLRVRPHFACRVSSGALTMHDARFTVGGQLHGAYDAYAMAWPLFESQNPGLGILVLDATATCTATWTMLMMHVHVPCEWRTAGVGSAAHDNANAKDKDNDVTVTMTPSMSIRVKT